MNMKKTLSIIVVLVYYVFNLESAQSKLNVVASLPDLGAIAKEIGSERIKLTVLAGPNEDPHFIDPKPSFVRNLNQADVLIENGAELEAGWLPPLVNNARNPKILPGAIGNIQVIKNVRLLEVPIRAVDRSQGDVHPFGNPHFLLAPDNCITVASNIMETFSAIDKENAAFYSDNFKNFVDKISNKIPQWRKALEPYKGTKVITYHKSFNYLIEYFGLELSGTIEPKPGIEPSPAYINSLIPNAKKDGVKLVIIEPNRPRKTPEYVAKTIGAKLITLPLMPGGEGPADFFGWFDYIVKKLSDSLKQ